MNQDERYIPQSLRGVVDLLGKDTPVSIVYGTYGRLSRVNNASQTGDGATTISGSIPVPEGEIWFLDTINIDQSGIVATLYIVGVQAGGSNIYLGNITTSSSPIANLAILTLPQPKLLLPGDLILFYGITPLNATVSLYAGIIKLAQATKMSGPGK